MKTARKINYREELEQYRREVEERAKTPEYIGEQLHDANWSAFDFDAQRWAWDRYRNINIGIADDFATFAAFVDRLIVGYRRAES